MKKNVFIIESDYDFSKSLQLLLLSSPLQELASVAGVVTTFNAAKQHIDTLEHDIYLVDTTLEDGSGIDLIHCIHAKYPKAKVLALAALGHEKDIFNSIQAGASGYLLKSEMPANIIQSIVSLVNDGGYLSGQASKLLIAKFFSLSTGLTPPPAPMFAAGRSEKTSFEKPPQNLTRKEYEILTNAQSGSPAKIIAYTLGISIFTVNQHLRSIYRKLNVHNKMEAVQSARRLGLL